MKENITLMTCSKYVCTLQISTVNVRILNFVLHVEELESFHTDFRKKSCNVSSA